LLLFLVLDRMTGCRYRCAFVAALFGVHPLHVESVAWIAERKDVLSTLFWLLTIAAYVRYSARRSRAAYAAVVVALAAGLLAKPMLVTLPLVLLLLDYWPLARWKTAGARTLLLEKLPLFLLAGASAVVTLVVQRPAMERKKEVALGERVANALVSCVVYIEKTVWPSGLAIFYPYPRGLSWQPIAAGALLAIASFVVIRLGRARPWLPVGWLWYVITLVPVSGIVQVGLQARADRYTYVPLIGLFIVVAWGATATAERFVPEPAARRSLAVAAVTVLIALSGLTWTQLVYWRDGVALFSHAIDVTADNALARFNLADAYDARGDEERAMIHLREAVRIDPRFPDSHFNLTSALIRQRKLDEAEVLCRQAQEFWPKEERTLVNLGIVELLRGNFDEAAQRLDEALRLYPDSAVARHNLAVARAGQAKASARGR
jgi:Tfp pilus assembly protein PilF